MLVDAVLLLTSSPYRQKALFLNWSIEQQQAELSIAPLIIPNFVLRLNLCEVRVARMMMMVVLLDLLLITQLLLVL